jgi:hypothetical protein
VEVKMAIKPKDNLNAIRFFAVICIVFMMMQTYVPGDPSYFFPLSLLGIALLFLDMVENMESKLMQTVCGLIAIVLNFGAYLLLLALLDNDNFFELLSWAKV